MLALRLPFRGNRRCQGGRGDDKPAFGRRAELFAIEQDTVGLGLLSAWRDGGIDAGNPHRLIKSPR